MTPARQVFLSSLAARQARHFLRGRHCVSRVWVVIMETVETLYHQELKGTLGAPSWRKIVNQLAADLINRILLLSRTRTISWALSEWQRWSCSQKKWKKFARFRSSLKINSAHIWTQEPQLSWLMLLNWQTWIQKTSLPSVGKTRSTLHPQMTSSLYLSAFTVTTKQMRSEMPTTWQRQ